VGALVDGRTDPFSGQPECKATPAALERIDFGFQGFALTHHPIRWPANTWWARIATDEGGGYLVATDRAPSQWHETVPDLFGPNVVLMQYVDPGRGVFRVAAFHNGRLTGCIFLQPPGAAGPEWTGNGFGLMPGADSASKPFVELGALPIVCACFGVGLDAIRKALISQSAPSAEAIGRALRAGTKCGTCLPELRSLAQEYAHEHLAYAG
jgi:assimilatory nitrate reductase catalytic subunit